MSNYFKKELSKKNPYRLTKARTNELHYFVMQYNEWRRQYAIMDKESNLPVRQLDRGVCYHTDNFLVDGRAIKRASLDMRIKMVEDAAMETDELLAAYIITGVCMNISYDVLRARRPDIPCCRETYYATVRKFFWILDKKRD